MPDKDKNKDEGEDDFDSLEIAVIGAVMASEGRDELIELVDEIISKYQNNGVSSEKNNESNKDPLAEGPEVDEGNIEKTHKKSKYKELVGKIVKDPIITTGTALMTSIMATEYFGIYLSPMGKAALVSSIFLYLVFSLYYHLELEEE